MKVTDETLFSFKKRVNTAYWRWENWLQGVFIPYMRIPVFIVVGFLVLATADYIYYGNKKDISALPKPTQERYNSLLFQHGEAFKNRWELEGQNKYKEVRNEIDLELQKIRAAAPYASWGRNVVNYMMETLWNIKIKN